MELMQWKDLQGNKRSGFVLRRALEVVADSEGAAIVDLLAARLEILQVFFGGTQAVAEEVGVPVHLLRKFRHRNYFELTGKIMTRIDDAWDRVHKILKYGQKS